MQLVTANAAPLIMPSVKVLLVTVSVPSFPALPPLSMKVLSAMLAVSSSFEMPPPRSELPFELWEKVLLVTVNHRGVKTGEAETPTSSVA